MLERTFEETDGYDEIVLLRDIRLESTCEHHMAPIIGRVHVAYLPHHRVVGISKLARVVEAYAKRLQIQEKMTAQIANTIQEVLEPRGVAVVIEAAHQCMTTRGVHKPGVTMVTSRMLGAFRDNATTRRELLAMIGNRGTEYPDGVIPTTLACDVRPLVPRHRGRGTAMHDFVVYIDRVVDADIRRQNDQRACPWVCLVYQPSSCRQRGWHDVRHAFRAGSTWRRWRATLPA